MYDGFKMVPDDKELQNIQLDLEDLGSTVPRRVRGRIDPIIASTLIPQDFLHNLLIFVFSVEESRHWLDRQCAILAAKTSVIFCASYFNNVSDVIGWYTASFISEMGDSLSVHLLHFVHLCALIRLTHPRSQEQVFSELVPYYAAHCEMYGGMNERWKLACLPICNTGQCHVHLRCT